jgi:hypothetical protein
MTRYAVISSLAGLLDFGLALVLLHMVLYCDPTLEPRQGEPVCVHAIDGTVTVKKFLSKDEEFIHMQGWNDRDKEGRQKVMNIDYANIYVKSVAVVILVRRRA